MKQITGGVTAAQGFSASGSRAGLKETGDDIAVVYSQNSAQVAAVFTTNQAAAAPVKISRQHCQNGKAQAIVVNSGNANACTGEEGWKAAQQMAETTARELDLDQEDIIVASTGVIGKELPVDQVTTGIRQACSQLGATKGSQAAQAIRTTDTYLKEKAVEIELAGKQVKIGGMAKGSGMIEPNMATMLSFVTTDVAIESELLQQALQEAVNNSFQQITVDGEQSTNDMVGILANGQAGNELISDYNQEYHKFQEAVEKICRKLARDIVQDGEGATKFVEINLQGAREESLAEQMAKKIANSNLVKTAIFGEDPNWGRIVATLAATNIEIDLDQLTITINEQPVFGPEQKKYDVPDDLLASDEVLITVDLNLGHQTAQVWTCDLSCEYVEINAEYHT
ncbi:bifunctional glutamate N-acetyltransferase/amino-acid acetyltransferase ArgJ [Halanaerobaculum tunisiense]